MEPNRRGQCWTNNSTKTVELLNAHHVLLPIVIMSHTQPHQGWRLGRMWRKDILPRISLSTRNIYPLCKFMGEWTETFHAPISWGGGGVPFMNVLRSFLFYFIFNKQNRQNHSSQSSPSYACLPLARKFPACVCTYVPPTPQTKVPYLHGTPHVLYAEGPS